MAYPTSGRENNMSDLYNPAGMETFLGIWKPKNKATIGDNINPIIAP
jgi:hypothetical protein